MNQILRLAVLVIVLAWSRLAFCGEIHYAAKAGDLEKVKALLKENPNLVFSKDGKGQTPLLLAVKFDHRDVAAFLLANKADVNSKAPDETFYDYHGRVAGTSVGGTCLNWAVEADDMEMVELLLTNSAKVNLKDGGGSTPLHWAAQQGRASIAELLLAHKADANSKDDDGYTPLHWATKYEHKNIAELLLANGAKVNAKDNDGDTPLHLMATSPMLDQATQGENIRSRLNHSWPPCWRSKSATLL